ncbi:MAG TPA: hypothetical protein VEA44_17905 [Caulobacter sp.]|nr:hypothetical protein [Caulobacter sp.]
MFIRRLALAALALAATSLAAPAFAAPKGACLWGALTDANRATMIQGYRTKGAAYLAEIQVDPTMENALRTTCKLKPEEELVGGEILGAVILEKGADTVLFEKAGIARGSLDKAWAGLPEADREALRVFGLAAMRQESAGAEAAIPVIARVTAEMKLPSKDLDQHVFAYLLGRAIREGREAGRT